MWRHGKTGEVLKKLDYHYSFVLTAMVLFFCTLYLRTILDLFLPQSSTRYRNARILLQATHPFLSLHQSTLLSFNRRSSEECFNLFHIYLSSDVLRINVKWCIEEIIIFCYHTLHIFSNPIDLMVIIGLYLALYFIRVISTHFWRKHTRGSRSQMRRYKMTYLMSSADRSELDGLQWCSLLLGHFLPVSETSRNIC